MHAGHLGRVERRVMSAIELCRTEQLGGHSECCASCGFVRCAYNSCRNRHCPKCQGPARREWLAARQTELLPLPYFHVVFTLPAPVAEIAFQNKAAVYAILFKAVAATLRTIAADPKHLGAEIGIVAVLHTWGQNLHHHPHLHCVVPGGGLSLKPAPAEAGGTRWIACRPGFFLPVRFHLVRHYGFLANGHRDEKLALCRQLLAVAPATDHSTSVLHHGESTAIVLDSCPCCGGMMITLATLPRSVPCHPSFWHDSS